MITLAKYLISENVKRCGIVPYVVINNEVHFLFAIDSDSGELTDFGGGVRKKECSLMGGIREFREESVNMFEDFYYTNVNGYSDRIALIDCKNMAIVFLPINEAWFDIAVDYFQECKPNARQRCQMEVSDLQWVNESEFVETVYDDSKNGPMWIKVKKFFQTTTPDSFMESLRICY